ncbi:hypothetical protein FWF74_01710 [Candidatus Saccharibacteria bacterium]|nr:hypothetical protein [Candidatus Saccharibacteria bacterium]MCL1963392.1 hypothetical protein [Candidatus Saccharibacteria bacterium]
MKRVLIDVDDVICTNHFLGSINRFTNKNYKMSDFTTYSFEHDIFKTDDELNAYYDYYLSANSYDDSELMPDCYEVLEKMIKKYEVYLTTSCVHFVRERDFGRQFGDKFYFLLDKLPFFPPNNIIMTNRKDIINGDVIIDDRLKHLTDGKREQRLLFDSFHNKEISDEELQKLGITRVRGWKEIGKILRLD